MKLLNEKPAIGILSGVGSWLCYIVKSALTDDFVLKIVAGIGIWIGVIVAMITFYLRIMEIGKIRKEK